ncbi:hypothetical protein B0T26DRAFT_827716 [Lasiosphaeria miniovina]|uniref:Uncharacterized protein n=1 Tax=Lasiosphaeria miniovina TaxID=1954250 RepID=A0AA40E0D9_9PEZI|nr:uncharacterized protein B0T26DRAFT_827716 [Lasiosphaeria miniovina]KAK0723304.1 hypothetical protein B0T26DRAFT_827716 [Lasiosphaeria miniovina]
MDPFVNKIKSATSSSGKGASEKNEDYLDKGVDLVQEKVFKQGQQKNETDGEQAKDEKISDGIRTGYRKIMGKDIPIQDK